MPTRSLAAALAALLLALPARGDETPGEAAVWAVGTRLEPFVLQDAHGEDVRIDESVDLLLFVADMDAGDLVEGALEDPELQDLEARGAVFVSDISRMPGLVTTLFALPAMRRRPYRMVLDRGPGPTAPIPREDGRVTAVRLEDGVVASIDLLGSAGQVAAALRATRGGADVSSPGG